MNTFKSLMVIVVAAAAIVTTIFLGLSLYHGSARIALAALRGSEVVVTPEAVDLGDIEPLSTQQVTFRIRNISNRPIRIFGAKTSCACSTANLDFPVTLSPGKTLPITLTLKIGKNRSHFLEYAVLYSDSESNKRVELRIEAQIQSPKRYPEKDLDNRYDVKSS